MTHETIDLANARSCMAEAVALADSEDPLSSPTTREWIVLVERFSEMCEKVSYRSSIAVLGNAMLAKATNERIDVFSLKASADHPGAYDARRTAEKVLVPASQRHRFHLGVTGPQPLNNQPFFRHLRIESKMTVRENARALLAELLRLLHRIGMMRRAEAIEALAGFVVVRRRFVPAYDRPPTTFGISTLDGLMAAVDAFVRANSEGGGRAMACAAGLLDASYGEDRVRLGKINEPDRQAPGDIGLRTADGDINSFERVLEVRDKAVESHTIYASVAKAVRAGVHNMTVVAVSDAQKALDVSYCRASARDIGADLAVFLGWDGLVTSLGSWFSGSELKWVEAAITRIRVRLQELGLSAASVSEWDRRTASTPSGHTRDED
ncbi:MAG: restriction endonuclease, SacI family [Steroidobacteraceae bacterium]